MNAENRAPTAPEAEAWLRAEDAGIRIILAEFAEYAGRANVLWSRALDVLSTNPDMSLSWLIDLEILLENLVQVEIDDTLKVVREGLERLADELPDDGAATEEPRTIDGPDSGKS